MAVYVDNARIPWRGKLWCHLLADTLAELHEFAARLNLQRHWFQEDGKYPHYDVTTTVRELALTLDAVAAGRRQIIAAARLLREEYQQLKAAEAALAKEAERQGSLFG